MRIHSLTHGASSSGPRRPGVEYDVDESEGRALVAAKAAREVKLQTAIDPAPAASAKPAPDPAAETATNPAPAGATRRGRR